MSHIALNCFLELLDNHDWKSARNKVTCFSGKQGDLGHVPPLHSPWYTRVDFEILQMTFLNFFLNFFHVRNSINNIQYTKCLCTCGNHTAVSQQYSTLVFQDCLSDWKLKYIFNQVAMFGYLKYTRLDTYCIPKYQEGIQCVFHCC